MQSITTPVMASLSTCKLLWPTPTSSLSHSSSPQSQSQSQSQSLSLSQSLSQPLSRAQSQSQSQSRFESQSQLQSQPESRSESQFQSMGGDVALVGRREAILGGVAAAGLSLATGRSAEAYTQVEVGTFLPRAEGNSQFVQFEAKAKDTPALRAGNVQPYKFILPPTWKQVRIANILSGNYCQPKCAEPWVEVKFESAKEGTVQVVASPMVRLSNKPNATIEEIGNPEKIISALGPFVTGNSYDPDEVMETSVDHRGDLTYYSYQLETPFALTGAHNLATATAKGNVVLLCVVSANDKQWAASQGLLKTILKSFTA